jgi:hypothetical protein
MQNYNFTRHYATNLKVAGSIPDGVTGIFHWHNPSYRTVALRSTWPLTEMSTRDISLGGKGDRVRKVNNVSTFMCGLTRNSGSFNLLQP